MVSRNRVQVRRCTASASSTTRERSWVYGNEGHCEEHTQERIRFRQRHRPRTTVVDRHTGFSSRACMCGAYRRTNEIEQASGSGHDRVCDFGWRDRSHCDSCHNGIPPQAPRALGCYRKWHKQPLTRHFRRHLLQAGQSTVEFALVTAGLLAVFAACGALWHFLDAGILVQHALSSASHHVGGTVLGGLGDVFLY